MPVIEDVRDFNRFYTRKIRLLDEHLPASDYSLPEARVIYELAKAEGQTAAEIGRRLDMDKAFLSRIIARLKARGMAHALADPTHGRRRPLSLTPAGKRAFADMEEGTRSQLQDLLAPLDDAGKERLIAAMRDIRRSLDPEPDTHPEIVLRGLQPGDLGWIAHRQMVLYHREYGWNWEFEGLVCDILAKFVAGYDSAREDAWVAQIDGAIAGSVFLTQSEDAEIARLRLLYVEPHARGSGIGRRLVRACIARARALGYRTLVLWTNDILSAARRIYQTEGFELTGESRHHSFGHDLVGQTWRLELAGKPE